MRINWKAGGLGLFLGTWFVYSICPPFTSYDSYWTVPTTLNILAHGTTNVDQYQAAVPAVGRYDLECVPASGRPTSDPGPGGCRNGHWYNWFPVAVSFFALPLIVLFKALVAVVGPWVRHAGSVFSLPPIAAFFAGDFVKGHSLAELWCASTFGAITVWLEYRIAKLFLPSRQAVWLALLFAFGTSEWSIASRNLSQHGLSVLLLSAALYLVLLAREAPARLPYAALPLALAFAVRPSNAVSAIVLTVYVAVHYRRYLLRFVLCAAPVAAIFFGYQVTVRHSFIPYYVTGPRVHYPEVLGIAMNLVSPNRGLLIFTPVFVVAIAGMAIAWRRRWCFPLVPYLIAILCLHTAVIASIWPGHCFGPRYYSDMGHLFLLFLIPAILEWRKMQGRARTAAACLFLALAAFGVFVHSRGATSRAANQWSILPVNVDSDTSRVWDWKDLQFLRGIK
ncbi:MAG: hypothetical protein WB579_25455 [Bryobacteraceae bacterium]